MKAQTWKFMPVDISEILAKHTYLNSGSFYQGISPNGMVYGSGHGNDGLGVWFFNPADHTVTVAPESEVLCFSQQNIPILSLKDGNLAEFRDGHFEKSTTLASFRSAGVVPTYFSEKVALGYQSVVNQGGETPFFWTPDGGLRELPVDPNTFGSIPLFVEQIQSKSKDRKIWGRCRRTNPNSSYELKNEFSLCYWHRGKQHIVSTVGQYAEAIFPHIHRLDDPHKVRVTFRAAEGPSANRVMGVANYDLQTHEWSQILLPPGFSPMADCIFHKEGVFFEFSGNSRFILDSGGRATYLYDLITLSQSEGVDLPQYSIFGCFPDGRMIIGSKRDHRIRRDDKIILLTPQV